MKDNSTPELNFGDYVTIEMFRYGCENELYSHKVVTRSRSNAWVDVPVKHSAAETLHDEMADVVWCICEGVCENEVLKYRVIDVKKQHRQKLPPLREVVSAEDVELKDKIATALTSVYVCTRVWEAWQVGTMTQDDFEPADECENLINDLASIIQIKK